MAIPNQPQGQQPSAQGQQAGGQKQGQISAQQGPGRQERGMARREPFAGLGAWEPFGASPFSFMRRMIEDMDRLAEDFSLARGGGAGLQQQQRLGAGLWVPQVEAFEREGNFVVRADLPGLKKDDVRVEISDEGIVLEGERKSEHEERKKGLFHSERSYGSFRRVLPLPENVQTEDAKATFQNGVLEIVLKMQQQASRNRRIDIQEGEAAPPTSARH